MTDKIRTRAAKCRPYRVRAGMEPRPYGARAAKCRPYDSRMRAARHRPYDNKTRVTKCHPYDSKTRAAGRRLYKTG